MTSGRIALIDVTYSTKKKDGINAGTLKTKTGRRTGWTCIAGKKLNSTDAKEVLNLLRMIGRGDMCEGSCRCEKFLQQS